MYVAAARTIHQNADSNQRLLIEAPFFEKKRKHRPSPDFLSSWAEPGGPDPDDTFLLSPSVIALRKHVVTWSQAGEFWLLTDGSRRMQLPEFLWWPKCGATTCSLIEVHGWHDGNPKETRRQAEERDLLTDVTQTPSSGGIIVKAVVCDQGANNCTLARRLGVTPDHPFFLVGDTQCRLQPGTMPEPLPAIKTDEFDLPDE
ncbi:hypothetical protein HPB47_015916 [Ixodes persulcatus]|uniref:Uncharacterized protein n=1 Tax=Ixodes persulcatus TaxID=34615 RepID=A0AC60QS91_IXOPE|nr:hypothetical protein HPB47_015916 [Ixodes persulcatus]